MVKVIGIWNRKGGVGSTTLTGHFCFIAAELGLSVAGASLGGLGDLRHWLRPARIPWFDARREKLPSDVDLLVLDVYSQTNYHEVLRPNIWLIPVDDQEADRRAVALASTLVGDVRRVRNFRHLACEVSLELESTDAVIPRCLSLAATDGSFRPVWSTPLGALSAGARAIRELAAEVFCRVGLLPPPDAPPVSHEPEPEVSESDAMKRLAPFFAELDAIIAAMGHEPMVEWVRGLK
jgi:hypothetical protein